MVLSNGWRCLCTSTRTIQTPLPRAQLPITSASFTTSAYTLDKSSKPNVKGMSRSAQAQQQRIGGIKKGAILEKPKPFYKVGERKQIRDRIVLSNTNAPQLTLPELTVETSTHEPAVGSLFAFSNADVDKIRILEAFQRGQDWKFFHRPSTVMRFESLVLGEKMAKIQGEETVVVGEVNKGTFHRMVICGPKGSGKSVLMLQATAWALQREWVVITIPNAHDLVIGHTEYDLDVPSGLWTQREYTAALLSRVASVNRGVLSQLTLSRAYKFGRHEIPETMDMKRFVEIGSRDSSTSHEVFMALLSELELPDRPPVLFTLDTLNEIMMSTEYRDPDFKIIHAHDLALPNTFLSFLSGKRSFPRGLIIGATSASGAPRTPALRYALAGYELPNFSKLDKRVAPSVEGAEVWKLGPMERTEAKALLEYCRESGLLRVPEPLDDEQVAQRITVSSGLAKELVASCVRIRA
ncbi:mitochondrial ribosomal death-associated protein 3-domain-containing protein [Trichophaea hybrida]|nr:mitochondrial ribosomal death-associated protein 3-domain-containing protein [Trichophaea hybrida]